MCITVQLFFFVSLLDLVLSSGFQSRYFSSAPLPTEPRKLPRPASKRVSKASDFNPQEGPTVLSPPRKSRRVMPEREGFEGNAHRLDKIEEHAGEVKQADGDIAGRNEKVPMSIDFSIFASKPPSRPTINRYRIIFSVMNS